MIASIPMADLPAGVPGARVNSDSLRGFQQRPLEQRRTSGGKALKSAECRQVASCAKIIRFWHIATLAARRIPISTKRSFFIPEEGLAVDAAHSGGCIETLRRS
jgi:hypothetical protein